MCGNELRWTLNATVGGVPLHLALTAADIRGRTALPVQWNQNYAALNGSLLLTALVVAIPIFFLFWALAVKRM